MRICHIGDINIAHLQNIINYLQKVGHENFLLTPATLISRGRSEIVSKEIELTFVGPLIQGSYLSPSFWYSRYSAAQKVKNAIKHIKPDIVHGYYLTDCGLLGAYSKFHPYLVLAIGSDVLIGPQHSLIKKQAIKYVIKSADLVLCYSKQINENILRQSNYPEKVKHIHIGVDLNLFKKQEPDESLLESLNISKNNKIIISLRNFEPIYNLECLIEAISLIIEQAPEARFILLGEGSSESKLINLSKKLRVLRYIRFLKNIPNICIPKYLNLANIYVSTSLSDGTSFSLLEAMACKKPVVVTDIPANSTIIKDFENGFLFPKSDSQLLAEKIIFLINDPSLCKQMGENNRKIVSSEYSFQEFMNHFISSCNELVNGKLRK